MPQNHEKSPDLKDNLQWPEKQEQCLVVRLEEGWVGWNGMDLDQRVTGDSRVYSRFWRLHVRILGPRQGGIEGNHCIQSGQR